MHGQWDLLPRRVCSESESRATEGRRGLRTNGIDVLRDVPHVLKCLNDSCPRVHWWLGACAVLGASARLLPKQFVEHLYEADGASYRRGEYLGLHAEALAAPVVV